MIQTCHFVVTHGSALSVCVLSVSHAVHQNYVGTDAEKSPFYLSVVLSDQNNQRVPQYRAILWRKTVSSAAPNVAAEAQVTDIMQQHQEMQMLVNRG